MAMEQNPYQEDMASFTPSTNQTSTCEDWVNSEKKKKKTRAVLIKVEENSHGFC